MDYSTNCLIYTKPTSPFGDKMLVNANLNGPHGSTMVVPCKVYFTDNIDQCDGIFVSDIADMPVKIKDDYTVSFYQKPTKCTTDYMKIEQLVECIVNTRYQL